MFSIHSLSKEYKRGHSIVHALQNVDLNIESGEFISFIGKSGSGKSTLLNILGGLDRPSYGKIIYDDKNLSTITRPQLAEYRKKSVGIIFQSFNLIRT
ncbi:MAG: ATP-binding cassette domain-containing protein [Bacteroidetes bacterium]|jgi:putative ABC transport system ATP-binding protein|nr:ATP-binding cassette domain-containing protein [Bacteroidota bacterium]